MPLRPRRFALLAFVLVGVALAEAALLAVWAFRDPERIRRGSAYLRGERLAARLGCFGCHGPEGRGLIINPGSFKGYIPPWDGDDWDDLVKSDAEFDEWVKTGEISRFRRNPLAAHFLDAQQIKMPGYRDILKPGELESLRSLVGWVRSTRKG